MKFILMAIVVALMASSCATSGVEYGTTEWADTAAVCPPAVQDEYLEDILNEPWGGADVDEFLREEIEQKYHCQIKEAA